jgi:transcriptional regulator with XRE-family HTH domain
VHASEIVSFRNREMLSQAELAGHLGVTPNTVARWERGELTPPGRLLPRALRDLERELEERRQTMTVEQMEHENERRRRFIARRNARHLSADV